MQKNKIIHLIAGARPNFVKIAPLWHALNKTNWCKPLIVHTGQHSDVNMSDWFFRDLELNAPDFHLNAQVGSHAKVTGSTMINYENLLFENRPDLTVVVGDVDSTIACALTAKKLGVAVAHLESGLRSGDRTMPEELNRILTDSICDLLLTPSADGDENLKNEGVPDERISLVGNIMIDSLVKVLPKLDEISISNLTGIDADKDYIVVTLHRPSNVDNEESLRLILGILREIAKTSIVVIPLHPRTKNNLKKFGLWAEFEETGVTILDPLGYIEFIALVKSAKFILTDSGGIQEETSFLGVPCLTLRPNTERPITIESGTNKLVTLDSVLSDIKNLSHNENVTVPSIPLWDGNTASRIVDVLHDKFFK